MADGGLRDCPRCKRSVGNADWLQGVCTGCGFDFERWDRDTVADEVERQQEVQQRRGWSPAMRGLFIGALAAAVYWSLFERRASIFTSPSDRMLHYMRQITLATMAGGFSGFGGWGAARRARAHKSSSVVEWAVAAGTGIAIWSLSVIVARTLMKFAA